MKQEMDKKVMAVLMIIMILTFFVLIFKSKTKTLEHFETNEITKNNLAMYIEEEKGYKEYTKSDIFPEGYVLNIEKSNCEDSKGDKVETEKVLSSNENKVTVKSNRTIYCTMYFDYVGNGSKETPYKIKYIEDLVEIEEKVNKGETTYENTYFEMWQDLDFSDEKSYKDYQSTKYGDLNGTSGVQELKAELTTGTGWKPIGLSEDVSFHGIFDGKEHSINNIYISNNTSNASVGLFGVIKNANIMNLKINGTIYSSVGANIGSMVGRIYGNSTIQNIESSTNITGITDSGSIGGIIGSISSQNGNFTLAYLINRGSIINGRNSGGIIGWIDPSSMILKDCHNYGEISHTGPINTQQRLGGLIGGINNGEFNMIIINSFNKGKISVNSVNDTGKSGILAGGIIGSGGAIVINSGNYDDISINSNYTGSGGWGARGISGSYSRKNIIINSFNIGNITVNNLANNSYAHAVGIISIDYAGDTAKLNNVYNVGNTTGAIYNYGILDNMIANPGEVSLTNAYYKSGVNGTTIGTATAMSENDMKSQTFVDLLNRNKNAIDLSSIDSSLSEYTLCNWKLGSSGYPELSC